MKRKTRFSLICTICLAVLCLSITVFSAGMEQWECPPSQTCGLSEEGTAQGSSFDHTYWLDNGNGDNFRFFVRNQGACRVKISINDVSAVVDPGQEACLTTALGAHPEKYVCHAYPVEHGTDFDIVWKCAISSDS